MSQLLASGGHSIGASASATIIPKLSGQACIRDYLLCLCLPGNRHHYLSATALFASCYLALDGHQADVVLLAHMGGIAAGPADPLLVWGMRHVLFRRFQSGNTAADNTIRRTAVLCHQTVDAPSTGALSVCRDTGRYGCHTFSI